MRRANHLVVFGLAGSCLLSLTGVSHATIVNFDDLVGSGQVTDGYGGIIWGGYWNYYGDAQPPYNPSSPDYRVYDFNTAAPFSFSAPVVFNGAFFSGYDSATVQFELYLSNALVATSSVLAPSSTPTFLSSGYAGLVDLVKVLSPSPDFFVMDDVTYNESEVPIPATLPLFAGALAGIGYFGHLRRSRKA